MLFSNKGSTMTLSGFHPATNKQYRQRDAVTRDQRGAILVAILVILLVVMIIFLAVLTYGLHRQAQHMKRMNFTAATFLAEAGIQRCLSELDKRVLFPDKSSRQSPNGGTISTQVTAWGPYLLVTSEGSMANQKATLSALIGSSDPEFFDAAISVCDENYPFVVTGHTQIRGDVNTGSQGLEIGRIRGEGVTTKDYHIGQVNIFNSLAVPSLDSTVLNRYRDEQTNRRSTVDRVEHGSLIISGHDGDPFGSDDRLQVENDLVLTDEVVISTSSVRSLFVGGSAEIGGRSRLIGPIEIVADRSIVIKDSAAMDMVLLYAEDSVVLAGNCRFSGTIVCRGRISVRDDAALVYPSLLLLRVDESSESNDGIFLSSSYPLESTCYASLADTSVSSQKCMILVDTATTLTGYLVSDGRVDLRGQLIGSVITEQFYLHLPPTTFVNWVKDCYIDRNMLSFNPVLPVLDAASAPAGHRVVRQDGPTP